MAKKQQQRQKTGGIYILGAHKKIEETWDVGNLIGPRSGFMEGFFLLCLSIFSNFYGLKLYSYGIIF